VIKKGDYKIRFIAGNILVNVNEGIIEVVPEWKFFLEVDQSCKYQSG